MKKRMGEVAVCECECLADGMGRRTNELTHSRGSARCSIGDAGDGAGWWTEDAVDEGPRLDFEALREWSRSREATSDEVPPIDEAELPSRR